MKILLLGRNGQVGWELQRALAPLGEVVALGSAEADFLQPESLAAIVRDRKPDLIANAAAYTAVDKAESEPDAARRVNADSPGVLAREAARSGAWLLHFSTDYVFDGSGDTPRAEDAPTGPLGVYGQTKRDGDNLIRDSGCQHLILRTSWVHAARGGNFAKTMLKLAAERDRLTVIADQFGAPTGADLLADVSALAVRSAMADASLAGTYHAVAGGVTTWHAYACFVIDWARRNGLAVKVADDAIAPVPTTAFPTPARRPLNSRLDTSKLQKAFGVIMPSWQQGVQRMLVEASAR